MDFSQIDMGRAIQYMVSNTILLLIGFNCYTYYKHFYTDEDEERGKQRQIQNIILWAPTSLAVIILAVVGRLYYDLPWRWAGMQLFFAIPLFLGSTGFTIHHYWIKPKKEE